MMGKVICQELIRTCKIYTMDIDDLNINEKDSKYQKSSYYLV